MKTKRYRDLGATLRDQPNTIIDAQGRGTAITHDYKVARYDPQTQKVTIDPLHVGGKPFASRDGKPHVVGRVIPNGYPPAFDYCLSG